MAKISFTLTNGGQTVLVDDTEIVKFQANSSTGSLIYVQNLGAQPQVLDVTADPSTVAGLSALFISLTQVNPVFPTAAVTFTLNGGSPSFIAGEQVFFAGGAANGQITTTNGTTTMAVTNFSGQTLAAAMSVQGVDSGAAGAVSGTPTYTYVSSQAFYLNAARVIEYSASGSAGTTTLLVNDGNTPNGSQIQVSQTVSAVTTLMAGTGYVTLGGAQSVTGTKTFTNLLYTKTNVTQGTSISTGVTANGGAGIITTVSTAIAAQGSAGFTVSNTSVSATSLVRASVIDYAGTFSTNGIPVVSVDNVTANAFDITISNAHGTNATSGVLKIAYTVN